MAVRAQRLGRAARCGLRGHELGEQLYRAADMLMRHREVLERAVFARVSELFGLDWTVTLYDLTNTYFEGEAPDQSEGPTQPLQGEAQ